MKLGDVIYINPESVNAGFPYDEIEYIDISSVGTGILEGTSRIKLDNAPSRAKRIIRGGDTILATVRPNLRSFLFVKNPSLNAVASTGFAVLRATKKIDPRFLYYTVTNQSFTDYLTANVKGAAYPAIDSEVIQRADIYLPDITIQRRIASILSAYDDLIENNTRRIAILEEMARQIYKEWFVHFRFLGHEKVKMVNSELGKMPEGWDMRRLEELYKTASGGTPSRKQPEYFGGSINWVKTQELQDGFIFSSEEKITENGLSNSSAKLFPKGTVLVAMYGATIGQLAILGETAATNQACCAIIPSVSDFGTAYAFLTLKIRRNELIDLRAGAAQQNISQILIRHFKILKPSKEIICIFNRTIEPLLNLIANLQLKNSNLRTTRDFLLPKLISGEIDVSKLPESEEAAA